MSELDVWGVVSVYSFFFCFCFSFHIFFLHYLVRSMISQDDRTEQAKKKALKKKRKYCQSFELTRMCIVTFWRASGVDRSF